MANFFILDDKIINISNILYIEKEENLKDIIIYLISFRIKTCDGYSEYKCKKYTDKNERDNKFEMLKKELKNGKDNILDLDSLLSNK